MSFVTALLSLLLGLASGTLSPAPEPAQPEVPGVTIRLDRPRPQLELPPVSKARGSNRPIVVIDPGHGGHDPGAVSPYGRRREKDVTLAIARAIRKELVASGRVRVALTRDDDRYLLHRDRFEIARRLKAGLFISIHADSSSAPSASGATIYTLSEVASDREAAELAARENKSDIIAGVDLGGQDETVNSILIDLALRESMDISADFAGLLYREASPWVPFRSDFHHFASLLVLKAPDIPSVLFESGYLTHREDVRFIYSSEGQKRIASGMRRAIEAHFARQSARARRS
jgi:N-acetylmuramoyl-L-alanine amidase